MKCFWCGKEVREVISIDDTPGVSHGICEDCMKEVEAEFNHGKGAVR